MSRQRHVASALTSWGLLVGGLASLGAVAFAWWAQHHLGMQPCPWCILQRMIFVLLGLLCLLAWAMPGLPARLASAIGVPLGLAGIAAALWQHYVAAASESCALTFADRIVTGSGLDARWPELFEVRASCADAAAQIWGVSFEFWSLSLFALVALACLRGAMAAGRRTGRV